MPRAPSRRRAAQARLPPCRKPVRASRPLQRPWRSPVAENPLRILIVDDETPARRRLRELLDDCAAALPVMVVGEAANGREAMSLLHTVSADLVLSDIRMPDMDGL